VGRYVKANQPLNITLGSTHSFSILLPVKIYTTKLVLFKIRGTPVPFIKKKVRERVKKLSCFLSYKFILLRGN
jgi:hypothetical protein